MAKQWGSIPAANITIAANSTVAPAAFGVVEAQTVMRMLGEYVIGVTPATPPTLGDKVGIAVGLGVISSDAFAAVATPDPAAEPEYPWMYWASYCLSFNEGAAVQRTGTLGGLRVSFDIRSMRKMKPRESLAWVIQYVDIVGTPSVDIEIAHTRLLLAVH